MNETRILSFDQSTQKTGWSVFSEGQLKEYGLIDLRTCKDSQTRRTQMFVNILELIKEKCPDVVVIEDTVYQRSPAVLKVLAQLQGAILGYSLIQEIKCDLVYPTEWRRILRMKQKGCKRKELKSQALLYVKNHFGLEVQEDEADAICIGEAYCKKVQRSD